MSSHLSDVASSVLVGLAAAAVLLVCVYIGWAMRAFVEASL